MTRTPPSPRRPLSLLVSLVVAATTVGAATLAGPTPAAAAPRCSAFTSTVYERFSARTGGQYLTRSASARSAKGWISRETPFSAASRPGSSLAPVHRLYRARTGNFFYSLNRTEIRRAVSKLGYRDLGVQFYASTVPASCLIPVRSMYKAGKHRMVTLVSERVALRRQGWKEERIRFYVGYPRVDSRFTLGIIPDTQQEVLRSEDRRFVERSRWLAGQRRNLDLRFVTHMGDVVNWDTPDHVQYKRAAAALAPLRAGRVPYSLTIGNHDTGAVCEGGGACDPKRTRALVRDTRSFNRYLNQGTALVRGRYQAGRVDNTYSTFRAGGLNWMVLNLELWPRKEVVSWARRVVATHPGHNVIVTTHSYLDSANRIYTRSEYGATSPKYLFDNLVRVYPNVKIVLCGHAGRAGYRTDRGLRGNTIQTFMTTMHDPRTNPVRLLEIDTRANSVRSWMYAPASKTSYPQYTVSARRGGWVR